MALSLGAATASAAPPQRVPELVSVGDGNMGDVFHVIGASDSGDSAFYDGSAVTEDARSAMFLSGSIATRSATGWLTESADAAAPQYIPSSFRFYKPQAFSVDRSRVLVWTTAPLVSDDQDGATDDLYLIDVATGAATWITHPVAGGVDSTPNAAVYYAGGSRDLTTVYFRMDNASLGGGAPDGAIYKWHAGQVEPASVLPDGTVVNSAAALFPHMASAYKPFNTEGAQLAHGGAHAVSDDGSTLFFGEPFLLRGLFARRDGTTVSVNASQVTGHEGEQLDTPVWFVGASHDADVVYFVENAALTDDGTAGGGLFRYTLSSGQLEQLTPDANDANGAHVSDALMSDDASHVYLVATAALAPGATAGQPNIYVVSGNQVRLVATVPAGATVERVSRSGRFAVIQSSGSINGAPSNGRVTLYEYDDQDGSIDCVSCRADGSPSQGDATLEDQTPGGFSHGTYSSAPRNISDGGAVFFATMDKLVPEDVTATADVYEYTGGELQLLSSGESGYDSYVQDNGDDGRDAFFTTRSALAADDRDEGLTDVYDARVGGGFPVAELTPACDGSDCAGTAPAPVLRTPATERAATPAPLQDEGAPAVKATVKKSFRVAAISAADLRRLAQGRSIKLSVVVVGGGRITVTSSARVAGKKLSAGSASRSVSSRRRVTAHVRWKLSKAALGALARSGSLHVTLSVRLSGVSGVKHLSVHLTRPAR